MQWQGNVCVGWEGKREEAERSGGWVLILCCGSLELRKYGMRQEKATRTWAASFLLCVATHHPPPPPHARAPPPPHPTRCIHAPLPFPQFQARVRRAVDAPSPQTESPLRSARKSPPPPRVRKHAAKTLPQQHGPGCLHLCREADDWRVRRVLRFASFPPCNPCLDPGPTTHLPTPHRMID